MARSRRAGTPRWHVVAIASLLAAAGFASAVRAEDAPESFFEKRIRPLLVERCYPCHSRGAEKVEGHLLLDSKAGVLKGGANGPAVVPGDPGESLLIRAVRYQDAELKMPPKRKLSDAEVGDLEAWIKLGAPDPRGAGTPGIAAGSNGLSNAPPQQGKSAGIDYSAARGNWPYQPPTGHTPPAVKNGAWPRNPIDRFILARLEEEQLAPAPEADRRTLVRRAYFDLLGVPPTPADVDAFLEEAAPDAYERLVDRLLASPLYGQRWARHWLDVVRYTDSFDTRLPPNSPNDVSESWRYRDWVVNAFNRDLPYDQFVMQQLAGDLLPAPDAADPNDLPAVATGVLAIGEWGGGDADKEKLVTDIVDDQVDLTGRAFLGLTLACARCHDHKFDPISTADYYGIAGMFFSSHILSDVGPKGGSPVMLRTSLMSPAEARRRKLREDRIAELEKNVRVAQDERIAALANVMLPLADRYEAAAKELQRRPRPTAPSVASVAAAQNLDPVLLGRWVDFLDVDRFGLIASPAADVLGNKGLLAFRVAPDVDTPSVVANTTAADITFLSIKLPARRLAIHPSPTGGVAAAWKSSVAGAFVVRGRVVDVDPGGGDGVDWKLVKVAGADTTVLAEGSLPNGGVETIGGQATPVGCDVKAGEFLQLNVFPKTSHAFDTTMIELEIAEAGGTGRTWDINKDVVPDLLAGNPHPDRFGNADVWYFRDLNAAPPAPIVAARIQSGTDERFAVPGGAFWTSLRNDAKAFSPETAAKLGEWNAELIRLKEDAPPPVPFANGIADGGIANGGRPGIHDVPIHIRGRYDRLGDVVPRWFPRVLAGEDQKPVSEGSGRLQLARWIASRDNPLTARVMVNRIWQHHVGDGIVKTANNFGKLGTPPTHPELLDWLAVEFVRSGWSVKAMHRMMMLSATYRQASEPGDRAYSADPDNLLLGRMNRRKLEAEALRDSMLAVAGKLDTTPGGPAVNDLMTPRRTLYVLTNRSDRTSYRSLFDAADPSAVVEKRIDSTVAPQALFLMNGPFVLAQAKALAERVAREGGGDDAARIDWLYNRLYGRPPAPDEVRVGRALLADVSVTPDARWEAYCQVLLCANEFMYVD